MFHIVPTGALKGTHHDVDLADILGNPLSHLRDRPPSVASVPLVGGNLHADFRVNKTID